MTESKKYWNDYYKENIFQSGKKPNDFLVSMVERMQQGQTLDVAMGEGENAVYLATKGFEVNGFDISDVAISRAQGLARDSGVRINAETADADMYLLKVLEYDSIIMTGYKPQTERFFPEMIKALKQGGTLLIEAFHIEDMDQALSKDEYFKNNYYKSNELLGHLRELRVLFYQEARVRGAYKVQVLAQKYLDKDAVKYDLFGMASKKAEKSGSKQLELAEALFKK